MDFSTRFFIGTAPTATSIAITANVPQEINKLQTGPALAITGGEIAGSTSRTAAHNNSSLILMGRSGRGVLETPSWEAPLRMVSGMGQPTCCSFLHPVMECQAHRSQFLPCLELFSKVMVYTDFSNPDIVSERAALEQGGYPVPRRDMGIPPIVLKQSL